MANYFLNDDGSLTKKNKKKKKGNNYLLQDDGTITLSPSEKEDIAPIKTSTDAKSDLLKRQKELQNQISGYDRKEKRQWWDKEDNLLENAGNVLYKAFLEPQDDKYVKDEKYDKLMKDYRDTRKQIEDITVQDTEYKDGFMGFVEKSGDTILGNLRTAEKGITSSIKKILGQEVTEDHYELSYEEKLSQKAAQESKGAEKVALDVQGSIARMMPQMAIGGASKLAQVGATALGFANYGGGAYNQARQDGYSDEQATAYGVAIGGMEMALTKALGSFGNIYGKTKLGNFSQGVINKTIPKLISNKQVREVIAQFGSEATEEFLQEYIDGIAKDTLLDGEGVLKSTWKNITDEDKFADALYSAFVGGITGSAMATPGAIDSYKYEKATGRDAETGLTKNEQTVLDSEISKRTTETQKERALNTEIDKKIKEFESTFGTITEAEKKVIKEQVKESLENGEIDYSTSKLNKKELKKIEEQVRIDLEKGNIDIDAIESTLSSEKVAQIKELQDKLGKTTSEQEKAQIQAEISELTNAKNNELKGMLGKDTYLQRSYGEANKKTQKFFYETTGYESEYKRSLAKDFEKVANDTTKSHELFETLSKIAEDKQTNYGVINNEQLKQLGYDVEGKDVNGLVRVNKDGTQKVLINIDSEKAINRIVGHETTHLLEGTKEYTELQEMVKQYATTKGDYDTKLKEITKLYDGVDADIEAEVTSDLVGDYLFTDEAFVNNLSTEKPSIFKKIYNEIKHLYKMATAGSKEARQLEKVKKAFDKAYKQNASNINETDTKYSVSDKQKPSYMWHGTSKENLDSIKNNGFREDRRGYFATNHEVVKSNYGEDVIMLEQNDFNLKDITSEVMEFGMPTDAMREQAKEEGYDGVKYQTSKNNEDVEVFNIKKLNEVFDKTELENFELSQALGYNLTPEEQQRYNKLKDKTTKYSLTDNQGRTLTKEQQEYFKDSKVRDENGNLKALYHGSNSEFTVFDLNKSGESNKTAKVGFWFTESRKGAENFANSTWYGENNPTTFEVYLNVKNPKIYESKDNSRQIEEINKQIKNIEKERETLKDKYEYGKASFKFVETLKEVYRKPAETILQEKGYSESQIKEYMNDLNEYNNLYKEIKRLETERQDLHYGDSYEQFRTDIYKLAGQTAEDANLGGIGMVLNNQNEVMKQFRQNLIDEGYDGIVIKNTRFDTDTLGAGNNQYVAFYPEQIKNIDNTNPTSDEDIRYSLSEEGQDIAPSRNDIYGNDIKLQVEEAIAPLKEEIAELKEVLDPDYESTVDYSSLTEGDIPYLEQQNEQNFRNIDESNMPIELEDTTPEVEEEITTTRSLEDVRDFDEVGSRKIKAYQYENPEVRPYFREMAEYMLSDLNNSIKGERNFNDQLYYDTAGEQGFYGTTRQTTDDIAELLDSKYKYTYKDIRKGLEAIIEDHGAENIAVAKRIELALDKRLREGYTDVDGYEIPANQEYIKLLQDKEIIDYYNNLPIDESMIPAENVENYVENVSNAQVNEDIAPIKEQLKENSAVEEKTSRVEQQTAQILDERPTPKNKEKKLKAIATVNLVDKGYYISKLARQTNNRQLDALWDNTLLSNAQAQEVIGEGRFKFNEETKTYDKVGDSVYEIFEGLETTDKVKDFNEYMYHKLNIERMSLEDNAQLRMKTLKETTLKGYTNEDINAMARTTLREDAKQELVDLVTAAKEYKSLSKVKNKPVFGFTTDANKSIEIVNSIEQNNPEFSDYAKKVYDYESGIYSDLSLLVESGILSQEDANYYRNKYESYVPIIRDMEAEMMEKQMFGKRASVGNAVKSATGGNQNIIPLKDAMAIKTMLVQRSANMNKLGLELMYALNPVVESETVSAENIIEDISSNKDLIQAGTNGKAPTMTVYEHGVKKTFEIPVEIYEALKTNYDSNSKITIKPLNAFSNFKRNVLTQYNPFFMVTNMIKDAQDVLINSQHPATTYKAIPEAIAQLSSKGYWYKEMQSQGLFQDTYYDNQGGFDTTKKGIEKLGEFYPLKKIAEINDFIERVPRMAEYIASRKAGRSVEVSSLDASRVTTNFKAGGDWTKFFNRNGATFLNASIQGAVQQVRNVQEAHQKGLKGYMALATKFTVAALPAVLLNNLLWEDDDEYEELSDYIKDNYYIIGKYGDGQFIRIPKGRMTAVIQKGVENMQNLITGDDEVDLNNYLELVLNNVAPSNPIENNIFSPFINTKLFNKNDAGTTWYGEDLVPTRLQSKPVAEQYDETTDEFSKWLGEKLNLSPIKINNLIDQNTGVIGDLLLPMMTAEAKTKNDNPIAAGIEDKFTADVVFDNKYSTDFYSVKEDLAKKSNSYEATDKDILKTKYMNSKQAQMNDIYAEIRDVQNSDLDKKTKYAKVRDLREQLNDIAETSLSRYNKVNIESSYAKVGEIEFRKNDSGEWQKITSKQLEKQNEATNTLGVNANNYWENKEEYDYAIENPTKYEVISQIDTYDNYIKYKDDIANIKEQYKGYSTAQRKAAVQNYIENLNLSVPKKIMLEKMAGGYSIKSYEDYMFQYIESLPMSAKEKQELHKQLFN